jgi:hypothetical protein
MKIAETNDSWSYTFGYKLKKLPGHAELEEAV